MSKWKMAALTWAVVAVLGACGKEKLSNPAPVDNGDNPPAQDGGGGKKPGTAKGPAAWFPLKVGYQWTYETEITGASACMEGTHVAEITRTHELGGKEYFIQQGGPCLDSVANYFRYDGATVEMLGRGTFLKLPKKGESWKWAPGELVWTESLESIEVPAGTFNDCWVLEFQNSLGPNTKDVYCPGVGMVQSEGQGYTARLTQKNF